ncbi:MAG: GNAT family N-acetyltransferase [Acidimicrobiia bacterium]
MARASIEMRSLQPSDDRSGFTCGQPDLDDYFKTKAGQALKRGIAGIRVALLDGKIVGYATTVATEIHHDGDLPLGKRLPDWVPALRLARLAVATTEQGKGVGDLLMKDTLDAALALRRKHGCAGVLVDAKPEAVGYYGRFKFEVLEVSNETGLAVMYLPCAWIEEFLDGRDP